MTRLPAPPVEVPVTRTLDDLAPKFRAAVDLVLVEMRMAGFDPIVFETLRTEERQAFLFGFGRDYDDGRGIVTHSDSAADTWHHYGLAVDIVSKAKLWSAPAPFWLSLGAFARKHGLIWGADWNNDGSMTDERFIDRPHVQWGNGMRRSPSSRAVALQASGGNTAVWAAVGAV